MTAGEFVDRQLPYASYDMKKLVQEYIYQYRNEVVVPDMRACFDHGFYCASEIDKTYDPDDHEGRDIALDGFFEDCLEDER